LPLRSNPSHTQGISCEPSPHFNFGGFTGYMPVIGQWWGRWDWRLKSQSRWREKRRRGEEEKTEEEEKETMMQQIHMAWTNCK